MDTITLEGLSGSKQNLVGVFYVSNVGLVLKYKVKSWSWSWTGFWFSLKLSNCIYLQYKNRWSHWNTFQYDSTPVSKLDPQLKKTIDKWKFYIFGNKGGNSISGVLFQEFWQPIHGEERPRKPLNMYFGWRFYCVFDFHKNLAERHQM